MVTWFNSNQYKPLTTSLPALCDSGPFSTVCAESKRERERERERVRERERERESE